MVTLLKKKYERVKQRFRRGESEKCEKTKPAHYIYETRTMSLGRKSEVLEELCMHVRLENSSKNSE